MIFNSFQFFFFLPVAILVYFLTPPARRWVPALVFSCYFYMCWKPAFIVLVAVSTAIDYLAGIGLDRTDRPALRRLLLGFSLTSNLGLLFTFKYLDFALRSVEDALSAMGLLFHLPHPELILPVGISFYTFQTLSYTIDVYRRSTPAEYHLGRFAVYVTYFPQLVAGPIERSSHLLPQFRRRAVLTAENLRVGFRLILWGLFKKMCVADLVAVPVNRVFAEPERFDGSILSLAVVFFAVQIYCDFSGYSDIAIGSARMMGIRLMDNFRQPYFSQSIGEFWKRWHISLSTWFRDYVYIPLGGNRGSTAFWARNILVTFVVSGIWHGASWNFMIWGFLHALYFFGERLLARPLKALTFATRLDRAPRLLALVRVGITLFLVLIAWVFFRARTLPDALDFLTRMFDWSHARLGNLDHLGLHTFETAMCFVMPLVLLAVDLCLFFRPPAVLRLWARSGVRTALYVAGIYAILLLGIFDSVDFIYFQF